MANQRIWAPWRLAYVKDASKDAESECIFCAKPAAGDDEANLIVNEIIPLDQLDSRYTRGMVVTIPESPDAEATLRTLQEVLRGYPGNCQLQLVLSLEDGKRVLLKANRTQIDAAHPELRRRVEDLVGPGNLRLLASLPKSNGNGNGNGRRQWAGKG